MDTLMIVAVPNGIGRISAYNEKRSEFMREQFGTRYKASWDTEYPEWGLRDFFLSWDIQRKSPIEWGIVKAYRNGREISDSELQELRASRPSTAQQNRESAP